MLPSRLPPLMAMLPAALPPFSVVVPEVCVKPAAKVVVPDLVGCCGFAGDRGFNYPELNASALQHLRAGVAGRCTAGYSTSRTCEIGLSAHSGIHYKSILYLVDQCSTPR